ncbi:unnamed protein product [Nezara viridula]|uniref:Uncharacterized protein n=1 Tax=Nezara viridula TaxID=85310 RepID=A0A9P0HEZ4_NEZVI|nr:unnamed protein product [Nezara viridula]
MFPPLLSLGMGLSSRYPEDRYSESLEYYFIFLPLFAFPSIPLLRALAITHLLVHFITRELSFLDHNSSWRISTAPLLLREHPSPLLRGFSPARKSLSLVATVVVLSPFFLEAINRETRRGRRRRKKKHKYRENSWLGEDISHLTAGTSRIMGRAPYITNMAGGL